MKIHETSMKGLCVLEPKIFNDDRGYFMESYNQRTLSELGIDIQFIQDNQSFSKKGVLRGLHFQKPPFAQTKLIRVLEGTIFDVVVDLRKSQPSYKKYLSFELSAENQKQLLIPAGFAHGFLVTGKEALIFYKCDQYYHPLAESGIIYRDPELNINWPRLDCQISVSKNDLALPPLAEIENLFL